MKVYSIGTQVFRGRTYLYLFCALILAVIVGLGCSSDKGCTRPTAPTLPRLGPTTWLDLDEDGKPDFVFEYWEYVTYDIPSSSGTNFLEVRSVPLDSFPWLDRGSVQSTYLQGPIPLPDSALIDSALGWRYSGAWLASIDWSIESGWESRWTGTWAGVSEMSLGLQLVRENASYFGWAKLSVDAESGLLTVHDYAYNHRAGLPVLAGVHPPLECTEMAGWSGFALILRPADPRFPAGRYDVHFTAGGDVAPPWFEHSCYFVVSDDPEVCGPAGCVTSWDCSAMYYGLGSPYGSEIWLQYSAVEGPVAVEVERDGSVVGTATFEPVYEVVYPNGPGCPPTCHQFTAVLIVE